MNAETLGMAAIGLAICFVAVRIFVDRSERGHVMARESIRNDVLPLVIRHAPSLALPFALTVALLGTGVIVRGSIGGLLAFVGLVVAQVGVVLAYVRPRLLLPSWLGAELDDGTVEMAAPDRWDWALFWLAAPIAVVGDLAIATLIVLDKALS